jgi:predicted enzyme related to lactoylglutathione lyase
MATDAMARNAMAGASRLDRSLRTAEIAGRPPPPRHERSMPTTDSAAAVRGIKFVSIPSRDQDRALAFWTEKIGLAIASDQPFDDKQRWIELRIPGADTRLVLFTTDGSASLIGGFAPMSFWSDDIDASYRQLVDAGVEVLGPPKKAEWGSSLLFKDPDGTTFHIGSR